jgi:hypothetical protein
LDVAEVKSILYLIFETYSLYIDRASRSAVHKCLQAIAASPNALEYLPNFIQSLKSEAIKTGIAPGNAFVLTEWCAILLDQFIRQQQLWKKWGLDVLKADAAALEICMGSGARTSLKQSALVVGRRGIRRLLSTEVGQKYLGPIVSALAAKGTGPTAKHAVILGVIAGVSARLPAVEPAFHEVKKDYYAFYLREVIGSKTVMPEHIATAFHDFFQSFATMEDLEKELVPAIEKALLRSPEVVLNDLISPLVQALPKDLDLSAVLQNNLLKPLMSNIKSTNAAIRTGALRTFQALASKSSDEKALDKIADEIANPLKQNKVPLAEQKALHSKLLASLQQNASLSKKIPAALAPVALKEANETALEAEIQALSHHLSYDLAHGNTPDAAVQDCYVKGVADKKPVTRKLWAVSFGNILWNLPNEWQESQSPTVAFALAVLTKMGDTFTEVLANPLPAAQNGLATVAYIFVSACLGKLKDSQATGVVSLLKKSKIDKQVLVADGKPSFLLNFRVYSKLSTAEDMVWGIRALSVVADDVALVSNQLVIEDAWSQAFLYFITASNMPSETRKEAAQALSQAYSKHPEEIGSIIISGLWQWRRRVDLNEKDTAAIAARTGNDNLYTVVRSICFTPEMVASLGAEGAKDAVLQPQNQLIKLLVLCHEELLPRTSWIDICLRTGVDPGKLVADNADKLLQEIMNTTEVWKEISDRTISCTNPRQIEVYG